MRSLWRNTGLIFSLCLGMSATLAQGQTGSASISNSVLHIPYVEIEGYGSVELAFRVEVTDEYLFVLQSFNEVSPSLPAAAQFSAAERTLDIFQIELDGGDRYSATLQQRQGSEEIVFGLQHAKKLSEEEPTSNDAEASTVPQASPQASSLYSENCAGCHGANGVGSSVAPSLIACANCASYAGLVANIRDTMPLGRAIECDQACASDLAALILTDFNATNEDYLDQTQGFIQTLNATSTLRKAAMQLASRLPTQAEYQLAAVTGNNGLRSLLLKLMEEEAFYQRLREIFNDFLLTDKYHSNNGSEAALSLLSSRDWPSRRWFDPGSENRPENYNDLRRHSNDGVAREPLELINYVVRNNRPFTEILTADYMMVNPFSARSYSLQTESFADSSDPNEFHPVQLGDHPHAGILTSPMFLNRYPTTQTNRNRGRARVVFDIFLDTDILAIEGVRPGNSVDLTTPIPTINNPECSKCHSVLDPVASLFQNWSYKGQYRPARLEGGWYSDMESRGFNGEQMPLAGNIDASLQWLGRKIAEDPRFPRAVTRMLITGLTGREPLKAPTDETADPALLNAFIAQRTALNGIQQKFIDDNYNLKTLVAEIMLSPYWRASGLVSGAPIEEHAVTGSSQLLTPEQLDRKIYRLLGFEWRGSMDNYYKDIDSSWASQLGRRYHQIYGGIDSDTVTTRLRSPNGLMVAMQLRMANELACFAVSEDFVQPQTSRKLFPYVNHDTSPYDDAGSISEESMQAIRDNIQYLHSHLLGEVNGSSTAELAATEQLFMDTINRGRQLILNSGGHWSTVRLHDMCDRNKDSEGNSLFPEGGEDRRLREDRQYVVRAWMSVLAYLFADYKFLYE